LRKLEVSSLFWLRVSLFSSRFSVHFSAWVSRSTDFWWLPDCWKRIHVEILDLSLEETGREIDAGLLLFFFFLLLCTTSLVEWVDVLFDLLEVASRLVCSRAASYPRLTAPGQTFPRDVETAVWIVSTVITVLKVLVGFFRRSFSSNRHVALSHGTISANVCSHLTICQIYVAVTAAAYCDTL
jgi:hypothetical protein